MKRIVLAAASVVAFVAPALADRVTSIDLGTLDNQSFTFHEAIFPAGVGAFEMYFYFGTSMTEQVTVSAVGPGPGSDAWLAVAGGLFQIGQFLTLDDTTDIFIPGGPVVAAADWDGSTGGGLTATLGAGAWWAEVSGTNGAGISPTVSAYRYAPAFSSAFFSVPEPSIWAMLAVAVASGLMLARGRRA